MFTVGGVHISGDVLNKRYYCIVDKSRGGGVQNSVRGLVHCGGGLI